MGAHGVEGVGGQTDNVGAHGEEKEEQGWEESCTAPDHPNLHAPDQPSAPVHPNLHPPYDKYVRACAYVHFSVSHPELHARDD